MVFVKDFVHHPLFYFYYFLLLFPIFCFFANGGVRVTEFKIRDYQNISYIILLYFPVRTEDLGTPPKEGLYLNKIIGKRPNILFGLDIGILGCVWQEMENFFSP